MRNVWLTLMGVLLLMVLGGVLWFALGPGTNDTPADDVSDAVAPREDTAPKPLNVEGYRHREHYDQCAIAGSLVDRDGFIVAGHEVSLLDDASRRTIKTDDQGGFIFHGLKAGDRLSLRIESPGCELILINDIKLFPGQTTNLGRLVLRPGGGVRGIVTGGGRPIQGARVTLRGGVMDTTGKYPELQTTYADAEGLYEFEGVAAGLYAVEFSAEGRASRFTRNVILAAGEVKTVSIDLDGEVAIAGRVEDENGDPVPGAMVGAFDYLEEFTLEEVKVDESGNFRIGGLHPGYYYVWTRAAGHASAREMLVEAPRDDLVFTLPVEGVIAGKVVTAAGQAVPRYEIRAYRVEKELQHTIINMKTAIAIAVNDPEGRFTLSGLTTGRYVLEVFTSHYAPGVSGGVEVLAGETTEGVTIKLQPGGVVAGYVLSKETEQPLQGAVVRLVDYIDGAEAGESLLRSATTDSEGYFKMTGVYPGLLDLHATYMDSPPTLARDVMAEPLGRNAQPKPTTIYIEVGRGIVRGRVLDGEGNGARGVPMVLQNKDQIGSFGAGMKTITDGGGYYAFANLPPGPYSVIRLVKLPAEVVTRTVSVPEGKTVIVNFGAEDDLRLFGAVRDGGEPLTGLSVMLIPATDNPNGSGLMLGALNKDGEYEIKNVRPGRYSFHVQNLASAGEINFREPLEIPRGEKEFEHNVDIPQLGFTGFVRDNASGEAVSGCSAALMKRGTASVVSLSDLSEKGAGISVSDAEGLWQVKGMQPGDYTIRFIRGGYAVKYVDVSLRDGGGLTAVPDVYLEPEGRIVGVVTDADGAPLAGVKMKVFDSKGVAPKLLSLEVTDETGAFSVGNLYDETYVLLAQLDGYATRTEFNIAVTRGKETARNMVLERGGKLRLSVVDLAGNPVAGARISMTDMQDIPVENFMTFNELLLPDSNQTDAEGVYWRRNLAPGTYKVYVHYGGPVPFQSLVSVQRDQLTDKPIRLDS